MLHTIDFEKKVTFADHMQLYYYHNILQNEEIAYKDWILTESLIRQYNAEEDPQQFYALQESLLQHAEEIDALKVLYDTRPWEVEKAVIWADRNKSAYYIKNLMDSHKLEVYAAHIFKTQCDLDIGLFYGSSQQYSMGETKVGIEIKCDKLSKSTGNYYFEYQERLHASGPWVNSGLLKNDNTKYYLYGDIGSITLFAKSTLLQFYQDIVIEHKTIPGCMPKSAKRGTSKGFIVSAQTMKQYALTPAQVAREIKSELCS